HRHPYVQTRQCWISRHARLRFAQRNLSKEDIEYVMRYGRAHHVSGSVTYYLRRRDIPADDMANDTIRRLEGTAVVLDPDRSVVITAWRDKDGLKSLRRRMR